MQKLFFSLVLVVLLPACQHLSEEQVATVRTSPVPRSSAPTIRESYQSHLIREAENQATPGNQKILQTGREMALINKKIIRGSCWDYINAIYNRAGYPEKKRQIVYKSERYGPYANATLVQPGDWLYFINHSYRRVGHSAIFVGWVNYATKEALMLSYGGRWQRKPARYKTYKLSNIYRITRPKS